MADIRGMVVFLVVLGTMFGACAVPACNYVARHASVEWR